MTFGVQRLLIGWIFLSGFASAFSLSQRWKRPSHRPLSAVSAGSSNSDQSYNFVILGGAGQIGSAVANHLLLCQPQSEIVLVGRRNPREAVLEELQQTHPDARLSFQLIDSVWNPDCPVLQKLINNTDCLIHTAGPYADRRPVPLQLAIHSPSCRAYVDISDPLPYLELSLLLNDTSSSTTCTALVAAGAFPGLSNVLGMEAVTALDDTRDVQTLRFHYFTAGLGGSGPINLFITNLGFGDPMTQFQNGQVRFYAALSGLLLGSVDFFLPSHKLIDSFQQEANAAVQKRVGTQQIFAWPFPEAATVPTLLRESSRRLRGGSSAGMGTAPAIWTVMLGILVRLVPRPLWRNQAFSKFLADFSQPLVLATDRLLRFQDEDAGLGETHAMRVDATRRDGSGVSIVQAHDSFRQCVGQSCAEFAMDCLAHPNPGVVALPEQRYQEAAARQRILQRLTSTPGTFCYTGPVALDQIKPPTRLEEALYEADCAEQQMSV
jgi:NAD(P)-dependent dehydrogenase (short-subunit alcohol dehydrogenase family)